MSEKKRDLEELNRILQSNDLLDDVNWLCESKKARSVIQSTKNNIVEIMKKLELRTPETLQPIAEEIRSSFEKSDDFKQKIIAIYKESIVFAIDTLQDDMNGMVVYAFKRIIPQKGIMILNQVCEDQMEEEIGKFVEQVYKDYIPEGMKLKRVDIIKIIHD